jgi:membrane-bound lytic murein transglycosylase D
MKITTFKTLIFTVLLIAISAMCGYALPTLETPKRRKVVAAQQDAENRDSVKRSRREHKGVTIIASPKTTKTQHISSSTDSIAEATTEAPIKHVRPNTPQQIDSVLALWRTSSTQQAYEDYFNDYLKLSKRLATTNPTSNIDSIYIARLEALMSPVPLKYNYEVREAIERFATKYYASVMSLAYFYFPMIEEELVRAGLPIELRTLAVIESALNPLATSSVGAKGIWQFMPVTGKEYGLEINSLVDERCNPRLSTQAACKYLKRMYQVYGDWTLAIASYNTGPGNVNKAIIRAGGDSNNFKGSFWDVYDYLHEQTRQYVPFYMGATYAFAYHKAHGIDVPMPPMPIAVDTIMIDRPMHLEQVSSTINVNLEVLKMLNPQYLIDIIPATSKKYPLTLPVENICEYLEHQEEIFAKDSTYLKEFVVQANLEQKRKETPQLQQQKSTPKYHTVASGETLGSIARKYGVTVKQLVEWNKLSNPDALKLGQKLKVGTTKSSSASSSSKTHTVSQGDTLGSIACKYGVTVKQLTEWNKLSNPDALKLGQKLKVSAK